MNALRAGGPETYFNHQLLDRKTVSTNSLFGSNLALRRAVGGASTDRRITTQCRKEENRERLRGSFNNCSALYKQF